ncbi:MAG: type VI secretion system lipoprotein TssJ [Azonexaceae bacterium]|nr:type VI secretion system lipoprotein TssJ [Azonexaceae bacterium]
MEKQKICLFFRIFSAITVALLCGSCAHISALQLAGTAVGIALDVAGVTKKDGDPSKNTKDMDVRIFAGDQLNTAKNGAALSLVTKIYILRSADKFKTMTYQQIATGELEKEALGEELVSVKEVVLLPGKSYDIKLKIPGDATNIGIVGMFRAPFQSRWKLAFDNKPSFSEGITVGAHACAFSATKGTLVKEISPESVRSLVGIQCNS